MSERNGPPAGRYGERSPGSHRRLPVAAAVVAALLFVGWVVWAGLGAATRGASADVIAYDVRSADLVGVTVRAQRDSGGRLGCSLQAVDRDGEVVGVADVVLDPARPGGRERQATVRTRARAATVTIGRCAVLGSSRD